MLSPLAALLAALTLLPSSVQAYEPAYIDLSQLDSLLEDSRTRHAQRLDAYETNRASRPETIERARKTRVLAVKLEEADGRGRVREKREVEEKVLLERQSSGGDQRKGVVETQDFFSQPLDVMIYAPVSIGTPSQTFNTLLDTGSADLWVYDTKTGSTQPEWDASKSSTAVTSPQIPWSIKYGKGSQSGFLNQDTVSLGGYTVNDTIFAAADTLNDAFTYYPISGLFGLGFGAISASGYAPWFERLLNSDALAQPYFSLFLVRASDLTNEAEGSIGGGQMCIGCIDSSKFTGDINWNPVLSDGFWSVSMDGIETNGKIVPGTATRAAIDSGTTLIQLPPSAADAFYSSIPGAQLANTTSSGLYIIPCTTTFSSLSLVFNGTRYEIPPQDLLRAISRDETECVLTIAASSAKDVDGSELAIVGDVFLKNAYSIFSYSYNGSPAVGFARSTIAGSWSTTSSSANGSNPNSSGAASFSQPSRTGSVSLSGAPVPTVGDATGSRQSPISTGVLGGGLTSSASGGLTPTRVASGSNASPTSSPTSFAPSSPLPYTLTLINAVVSVAVGWMFA
ncbi:hypothetical protein NBRC10513v2_004703 [Rhodotorula toruloides]